jgi:hypothetical protein
VVVVVVAVGDTEPKDEGGGEDTWDEDGDEVDGDVDDGDEDSCTVQVVAPH